MDKEVYDFRQRMAEKGIEKTLEEAKANVNSIRDLIATLERDRWDNPGLIDRVKSLRYNVTGVQLCVQHLRDRGVETTPQEVKKMLGFMVDFWCG